MRSSVSRVDPQTLQYRAEIARRLKAGRLLAGGIREKATGRVKVEIYALTAAELAGRSPLPENEITASLLGTIERMERHTPPMELQAIAEALGLGRDWFASETPTSSIDLLRQALTDLGLAPDPLPGEAPVAGDGTGHPPVLEEDDAA
jgi:hypothetical protein